MATKVEQVSAGITLRRKELHKALCASLGEGKTGDVASVRWDRRVMKAVTRLEPLMVGVVRQYAVPEVVALLDEWEAHPDSTDNAARLRALRLKTLLAKTHLVFHSFADGEFVVSETWKGTVCQTDLLFLTREEALAQFGVSKATS